MTRHKKSAVKKLLNLLTRNIWRQKDVTPLLTCLILYSNTPISHAIDSGSLRSRKLA
uniref:Uncharacterized protein n=1 Tax=Anguilla anguilla TaxID=7936 RepID=A0A0E9XP93_ANGAN